MVKTYTWKRFITEKLKYILKTFCMELVKKFKGLDFMKRARDYPFNIKGGSKKRNWGDKKILQFLVQS